MVTSLNASRHYDSNFAVQSAVLFHHSALRLQILQRGLLCALWRNDWDEQDEKSERM
jgi:hypothetical protein